MATEAPAPSDKPPAFDMIHAHESVIQQWIVAAVVADPSMMEPKSIVKLEAAIWRELDAAGIKTKTEVRDAFVKQAAAKGITLLRQWMSATGLTGKTTADLVTEIRSRLGADVPAGDIRMLYLRQLVSRAVS